MVDKNFNVYLIEVNTNPCLETTSKHLEKIIPCLIDNTLRLFKIRLVVDPLFSSLKLCNLQLSEIIPRLKYSLIFNDCEIQK